jgi:site-specific recombinase XerD
MVSSVPNAQVRLRHEEHMKKEWKLFKNVWISNKPVLPGVWQRKEGGHLVRARAKDSATGRTKDLFKVLPDADAATALKWLESERALIREGRVSVASPKPRFSEFAALHFEQKVRTGDIKSAMGRNKWHYSLKHLITAFGDHFIDKLHTSHIEMWRTAMADRVRAGEYAPTTINGWLAILRVLTKAARRQYQLAVDPMDGVDDLDTSDHETYTEEEPNALLPEEVEPFVAKFRELYPQHFAMFYLGLVTGLRPSTLRPLRRRGDEADVLWSQDRLLVRRSHTLGDEVMRTTKQKRRYAIDLPTDVMAVLRWHIETQLRTPEQQDSDLLFPSVTGGFRTQKVLNKPLAEVATELGIKKTVTQKALRRTFNDLARAAQVNDLVTRSISGHLTEQMQHHYSTVNGNEQREALTKVVRLLDRRGSRRGGEPRPGGEHGGEQPLPSGEQTKTG